MLEIFLLAFALSMDAFAVSIGLGVKSQNFSKSLAFKVALLFGFFQALMPLFGYLASIGLGTFITSIDHWIAFALLGVIGGKMLYESFQEGTEDEITVITNKVLLMLAIATSIDAMAAGFTLNLIDINPFLSMLIIGVVTFLLSMIGVKIGIRFGGKCKSKAELVGGLILVFMGFKILLSHMEIIKF